MENQNLQIKRIENYAPHLEVSAGFLLSCSHFEISRTDAEGERHKPVLSKPFIMVFGGYPKRHYVRSATNPAHHAIPRRTRSFPFLFPLKSFQVLVPDFLTKLSLTLLRAKNITNKHELSTQVSESTKDSKNADTWKITIYTQPKETILSAQKIHLNIFFIQSYAKTALPISTNYDIDLGT